MVGIWYGSSGVLMEGLRSIELRNNETQVGCIGLDSSSERLKQRGYKQIQTIQGLLRSGDDGLENRG